MARPSSRPRTAASAVAPVNPRTLFLASLGAIALGRREAERLATEASTVPQRLRAGADAAVDSARGEVQKLRKSALSRIAPLRREVGRLGAQVDAAREQGVVEAAKRLNPLLSRVGLPTITPGRTVRKAAKPARSRRPSVKKVAKTSRRRA